MPSAEVMKKLNDYGLKVKASASAVDEHEAERALTGKPPKQESNGKPDAEGPRQPQQTGMGFDRPATETARQRLEERQRRAQAAQARAQEAAKPKDAKKDGGKPRSGGPAEARRPTRSLRAMVRAAATPSAADSLFAPGRARPRHDRRRPPRRDRLAGRAPRARWAGRPRRSRWRAGRPDPPSAASRRPSAPRRLRGAGRAGRRFAEGRRHQGQLGVDRQGRRRVPRRGDPRGHQEADEPGGDGDPHADAVRRRDPGPCRRVRQGDRDRPRRRRGGRRAGVRGHRRGAAAAPAGRHDHGPRRPRQDVAAGRHPRDRGRRGRGRRHHPAHRRLPGPSERQDRHLPRHAGPRGVHRHACARRPVDRHRGHRGRRRRRREAADARGGRPREGGRRADPRRGQQDRQGGRAARARPHRR